MDLNAIIDLTEKELILIGVQKQDIPTLVIGLFFITWGAVITFAFRAKMKCSMLTCWGIDKSLQKINAFDKKLEAMLAELEKMDKESSEKHTEELRDLRHSISDMHVELSRLSGIVGAQGSGQKTRRIIQHEGY
jgi:hypothetical protein